MNFEGPLLPSTLTIGALLAVALPAPAENRWMSEKAMRAEFIGKTLRGHYYHGAIWTATYQEAGRYEVREGVLRAEGRWYFRGRAFCFFYGPPPWALKERCAAVTKISANCYQFHLVWPGARPLVDGEDFPPDWRWHSRGWRHGEPSTCEEKPSV